MIDELGSQFSRLVGPRFGKIVAYALGVWVVIQAISQAFQAGSSLAALLPSDIQWAFWLEIGIQGLLVGLTGGIVTVLIVAISANARRDAREIEQVRTSVTRIIGLLEKQTALSENHEERLRRLEKDRQG